MPSQPGYFTLAVEDLDRATTFFSGVLGWEFDVGTGADAGSAHITNIGLPGGLHAASTDPHSHLYFAVEDLDVALKKVQAGGGLAGDVVDSPSGRNVTCFDDQGTRFSLWQPAAGYA